VEACPSENEFVARATGALPVERAAILDAHIDACPGCRMLLAEAVMGDAEPNNERIATATFAPGEKVASRYVVVRWIAAGGMGEVYEVQDTWMDERIALKTIVASIADDPRALSRLKAEVRIGRRVTHENVCRVHDLGFHHRGTEQIAFLTMELVPGVTLRHQLSTHGPMDIDSALPLLRQMAEALRNAHAAGIVHRDFKSDNVMLVDSGPQERRIVVMDFGLARQSLVRAAQPLTPQSRTVFGTLDYMSPEQVMGRTATAQSDVYSLGIVIYELLTGRLPFEGDSPLARALSRVTQKAPSLAEALPGVTTELEATVARCLQVRPEDRFQSIHELLQVLGDPTSQKHLLPSRFRRHFGTAAVALLTCVNVAFAFALSRVPRQAEAAVAVPASSVRVSAAVPAVLPPRATVESTAPVSAASSLPPSSPAPLPPARVPKVKPPVREAPPAVPSSAPPAISKGDFSAVPPPVRARVHSGAGDTLLNPFSAAGKQPLISAGTPPISPSATAADRSAN
jgi:serine/threonine protein kinase